jgi:hypothetical protein
MYLEKVKHLVIWNRGSTTKGTKIRCTKCLMTMTPMYATLFWKTFLNYLTNQALVTQTRILDILN